MGHNFMLADIALSQISAFIAYLFPFLASVAFTLFLRRFDRKNSLLNQIRVQREELFHTHAEVKALKEEISELVLEFEKSLQTKANEIFHQIQDKNEELEAQLVEENEKSRNQLQEKTSEILGKTQTRVQGLVQEVEGFKSVLSEKETTLNEKLNYIQEIANNTSQKMNEFETALNEKTDLAAKTVENRLSSYSKKFQDRLELIFDQANHSISTISKDMRQEVKVLREEVADIHNHYKERETEFFKDFNSRKAKLFDEFSEFVNNNTNSLDAKFEKYRTSTEEVGIKIEKLDLKLAEKIDVSTRLFQEKMGILEAKFQNKFESMQSEANSTKEIWFKSFHADSESIRKDIRELKENLDFRREELVAELKKKTEGLGEAILKIKDDYLGSENKLLKDFDSKKNEMETSISTLRQEIKNLELGILDKIKIVDDHFSDLKEAINDSAVELVSKMETETDRISERIDSEIRQTGSVLTIFKEDWQNELKVSKSKYYKEVEEINSYLSGIKLEGKDLLEEYKSEFQNGREELENLYSKHQSGLVDRSDLIVQDIQNKIKKSQDEIDALLARLQKSGVNLYEKQETLLAEFGEKLHRDLQGKLEKVRFESEELLEYITKAGNNLLEKQEEKIDKFNSTLDERISRQLAILIDKGQLQLDALENRIASYMQEIKVNIETSLKNAREDSDRQISNFNSQVLKSYKEIESTNQEFLENIRRDFSRTKEDFLKLKTGIELEINRLNELKNGLYNFLAEESAKLQAQKVKSEQISDDIQNAYRTADELNHRLEELKEKIMLLTSIDEKIEYLQNVQSEFDLRVESLAEMNNRLSDISRALEISEMNGNDVSSRISQILSEVDILQQKENELEENLEGIEKKTNLLQARNQDFKSIESKFEKVEGLMMDLSTRHKQISTLQNRIETLKEETESMKSSLEMLLEEADEKFEKLSEFLTAVDSVASSSKKNGTKETDQMKKKKATVLQLYENFEWTPDTIAEKLSMEKSLVEAIINNKK